MLTAKNFFSHVLSERGLCDNMNNIALPKHRNFCKGE